MGRKYTTTGVELIDNAGSSVVDSTGLVSETQIGFTDTTTTGGLIVNGTAWQTLPGTVTITPTRTTNYLFNFMVVAYISESGTHVCDGGVGISVGGSMVNENFSIQLNSGNNNLSSYFSSVSCPVGAGTAEVFLRGRLTRQVGTAVMTIGNSRIDAIQLGN